MSGGQSGYELSEAKAILTELKSIRKAISSGEKEKQDLMQVCYRHLAKSKHYLRAQRLPWRQTSPSESGGLHHRLRANRAGADGSGSRAAWEGNAAPEAPDLWVGGWWVLEPREEISIRVRPAAHKNSQWDPDQQGYLSPWSSTQDT